EEEEEEEEKEVIEINDDGEFSFNLTLKIIDGRCVKLNSNDRWVVDAHAKRNDDICEGDKYYPYASLKEKASWKVRLSGTLKQFTLGPVNNQPSWKEFFGFNDDASLYAAIKRMLDVDGFSAARLNSRYAYGLEFMYGHDRPGQVFNNQWQVIHGAGLRYLLRKYQSSEEDNEREAIKLLERGKTYSDSKYDLEKQIKTLLIAANKEKKDS
ncbi:MAG: hypothetical protein OXC44_02510, partial [Proteobacteria bacterium]|nr:hypothetical protein [Pseudomonadota bacterium]